MLSVTPVRKAPKDTEEQTNQIIFGEYVLGLDIFEQWVKITTLHDGYTGWVDQAAFDWSADRPIQHKQVISSQLARVKTRFFDAPIFLTIGSFVQSAQLQLGQASEIHKKPLSEVIHYARKLLGTPYLWGGRSIFGIDCSGLTQIAYRMIGYTLRRDAWQQAQQCKHISLSEAQVGDLVFFTTKDDNTITHVGIKSGAKTIIHAHKFVREDALHSSGIFNKEKRTITHRYLHAGRIQPV